MAKIILDLERELITHSVIKEKDIRELEVEILKQGRPFDVVDYSVTLNGTNSIGGGIIQTTDITKSNNKVMIKIKKEFSQVPGEVMMELRLNKDDIQITTFTFKMMVRKGVLTGANMKPTLVIDSIEILNNLIKDATAITNEGGVLKLADGSVKYNHLADYSVTALKLGQLTGFLIDGEVTNIDTVNNQVTVSRNTWVVTQNGTYHVLEAGSYSFAGLNTTNMIFIYYDVKSSGFRMFNNDTAPKQEGLIFISSFYRNMLTHNSDKITLDGKSFVVNDDFGSLKGDRIENESLPVSKVSSAIPIGVNLFDKTAVTKGKYVAYSSGILYDNEAYFVSDFIEIIPGEKFSVRSRNQIAYFDEHFKYVSGVGNEEGMPPSGSPYTYIAPMNVKYVRVCSTLPNLDKYVLNIGQYPKENIPYVAKLPNVAINGENVHGYIPGKNLDVLYSGKNLFNKDDKVCGFYVHYGTGYLLENEDYFTSGFIRIKPSTKYTISHKNQMCFYGEDMVYISGIGSGTNKPYTFETPAGAMYMRLCNFVRYWDRILLEEGEVTTAYEEYKTEQRQDFVPNISDLRGVIKSKNLFDKTKIKEGYYVGFSSGRLLVNPAYFASDFIRVEERTYYTRTNQEQLAFYDKNKTFISGIGKSIWPNNWFETPNGTTYIRACGRLTELETFQIETGATNTTYEEYGKIKIPNLKLDASNRERLCTFRELWINWENGEKSPIGFLSDSTTDGAGTTGHVKHADFDKANGGTGVAEYVCEKAFPYIAQQLIRQETGNNNAKVYNIGYSGTRTAWAITNFDALFSGAYSDVKMVGLGHGINDRLVGTTSADYEAEVYGNFTVLIEKLIDKGIQPFMVLSQPTDEAGLRSTDATQYPIRNGERINSVCNKVKLELAHKYDLEVIDLTTFGERFMTYSTKTLKEIIPDTLHFADAGHLAEGWFIFSQLCPRTIEINNITNTILSYTSQCVRTELFSDKLTQLTTIANGFKQIANYTKTDSKDLICQDFWIINNTNAQINLTSHVTAVGTAYVKLDDVKIPITQINQTIGSLDIGVHHIQAYSGPSTKVDFIGFKMN